MNSTTIVNPRGPRSATRKLGFLLVLPLFVPLWGNSLKAQTQQAPPPSTEQPTNEQPPPLFPKHRRGIYKNNKDIEVIDATPQAPPLEIDDPAVPDKGEYEINFWSDADLSADAHKLNLLLVDANYGVQPKILGHEMPTQLKIEVPLSSVTAGGQPYTFGLGETILGSKFNFYHSDDTGLSLSVYPQLEFAVSGSANKGLAEPGQTLVLPLLMSKPLSYGTLVANVGIEQPFHDPDRQTTATFGLGLGRALTRKFAVMSEIHAESGFDFKSQRDVVWNGGVMYGVRNIPVYARIGRSLFSDEGGPHTFIAVGIKLISQPMHGGG